jgi:4-hydroxy-2-oxoheptanedioate aldolase
LDDIAAVEGYDMLFFGSGDYSNAIGLVHDMNHPRIQEARKRIAEAARAHGKFAGCMLAGFELQELVEMGYSFINVGCDVIGLSEYCRELAVKNSV